MEKNHEGPRRLAEEEETDTIHRDTDNNDNPLGVQRVGSRERTSGKKINYRKEHNVDAKRGVIGLPGQNNDWGPTSPHLHPLYCMIKFIRICDNK